MRKGFTLIELLIVVAIIAILAAIAVPNFIEAQVRSKVSRMKADMRSLALAVEAYVVDNNIVPLTTEENGRDTWTYSQCPLDYTLVPGQTRSNGASRRLSTPIAYISSYPRQPFQPGIRDEGALQWSWGHDYSYWMINFQGAAKEQAREDSAWHKWVRPYNPQKGDALPILPQTPVLFAGMESPVATSWLMVGIGPSNILDIQEGGPAVPVWGTTGNITWCFGDAGHYQSLLQRGGGYYIYDPTNGTTSLGLIYRFAGGVIRPE